MLRAALTALCLAAFAAVVPARSARAQTLIIYPWCTTGASAEFGARNCGFDTFEQCLASARGNGQSCEPNPNYQGPPATPKRAARKPQTSPAR